ncbi:MAG: hypothetical protein EXR70_23795 [Deltaproteobacteria bacterium]|nr:hypothetical protein [Deltaproteobacteria bacterium]
MKNNIARRELYWVCDIAALTGRSKRQVYRWRKAGLLNGHYRRRGAALELIFTADDVDKFLDHFLSPYELESDQNLEGLLSLLRKRAAKARASAMAKRYGR